MTQEGFDLPDYRRGEPLHESSASAVYRAQRLSDGRDVVIKQTRAGASGAAVTRCQNEYELLRSLDIPGVVKAYDFVRHEGTVALVLESLSGSSLHQWIKSTPGAGVRERLEIAAKLAKIVGDVHAARVIHKDVSSYNVVYDRATRVLKLVDFGIATRLRSEENKFQAPTALEGTLAYMAPEQTGRMNRNLDYRADLYSLGATLYELFTSRLPHATDDPLEMVHFHIAVKPVPPSARQGEVPEAVSAIIMKLLEKEPEARYQNATGVAADLEMCLATLTAGRSLEPFPLASRDAIDRFEPPQKLYGRAAEKRVLLDSFRRVASGGVETVTISGHGGVGKTSLVQEIYEPITRRRGYFAAGKFDQLQQNLPFSALVGALRDLVQQLLTESEEDIDAWRQAIRSALYPNAQLIIDVVPELALIIGPQPPVGELDALEAQNRFNLAFRRFLQVFCRREHPLVLFLDDMQWADPASLALVTLTVTAPDTEALLLVMTYRDNEVSANHPFMLAIKEQGKLGLPVRNIHLEPLAVADVAEFVADALRQSAAAAGPLAEVVHRKTAGNPFFMRQFLQALHDSKLIFFDSEAHGFRYDTAAIEATSITENVAQFLAAKLDKLPDPTREALLVAATIGNRFDLRVLAAVCERDAAALATDLEVALDDGLIVPLTGRESLKPDAVDSPLVYSRFAFLHDRVQQAAYAALEEVERSALHLAIGRALLAEHDGAQVDARVFDIVNHLDLGAVLLTDPVERLRVAKLNVRAGAKARDSTAYDLAVRSLRIAIELFGPEGWDQQYELMAEAHRRLAECQCLTADYRGAFDVIERALEHAASTIDRVRLLTIETSVHLIMGRIPEALACGRRAAREFAIDLPEGRDEIQAMLKHEIDTILERSAAIGVERLVDLPRLTDPEKVALMALLAQCLPAAYQSDLETYALLCCKMVRLSLEAGNCGLSARAYGSFGALLSGQLGRNEDAYDFARLGIKLAHRLDDISVYAGVYFLCAMFASHWHEPVDESIELFRLSVQYGLQSGDHLHAGYSAARRISHLQFRGRPLGELRDEGLAAIELLHRIGDATNTEFLAPRQRLLDWLQGRRPHGNTLRSDEHDEDECTAIIRARGNRSFEYDWFLQLAIQRYHCRELDTAYEFARSTESLAPFSGGFVTRPQHALYYALIAAALYGRAEPSQRLELDRVLADNEAKLSAWAAGCPENYGHMCSLVRAERARIAGARIEAADLYDRAISEAREQGFNNIEALAAELAARFWFDDGKADFGRVYLDKALNAYESWGAFGKVADLKAQYGLDGQRTTTAGGSATSGGADRSHAFDFATVLKAGQAIAGEIVLERLLDTLMNIIMENAGADSAVLLLESNGEFLVQAVRTPAESPPVLLSVPLRSTEMLSRGIVNYVIRTREHVVLADPAQHSKFRNDPYVRSQRPKSVLCAPVLHKGRLTGVLYLENNHLSGAFTPDRLEALNILLSQIAVSIENATLYAEQERQRREIEAANVRLTNEVAERKRAEEELNRYKQHLEDLVQARTRELEVANEALKREATLRENALQQLGESNEKIRALAYQDGLTGLPNRRLLNEHLEKVLARARRKGTEFALLFIDVDNFKLINDTVGHQAADEVLRRLAESLELLIRSEDVLAMYVEDEIDLTATVTLEAIGESVLSRLGGDEFIILLPDTRDRFAAGTVARRILAHLERPIVVDDHEVFVTVSIGIATFPEDGFTGEILIRNADTAMYHAKQQGKAAFQYYSAAMNAASVERLRLDSGLRRALEDGGLELHYQPQVDVGSGRVVGAEALVRWRHPERGYISPTTFIPIAEDSSLILSIGRWVIEQACRQAVAWQRAGLPAIPVSVNVSGVQFKRQDLVELVRTTLAATGLPAAQLRIEITETVIMSARERAIDLLAQLRALGVGLALDDFGTGYSSLSYLKSFPIDTLKIDRSFVAEMLTDHTTASIVEVIISMTRILGLTVLAEGVEDQAQFAFLKQLGCDAVQGFYVSRPMPAAELAELLSATRGASLLPAPFERVRALPE